ncbi:sufurtransferase FdhD [Mycobacterium sp. 852013-50091_SCH5140682]|uniref:formate dehydrogenase accessory sulfurtransferase FdhD n=1 Tax=Mycobacterium sp. 852013-50091_SCH5140682 TaxID=1834109 RepID=UPI0007EB19A7|nr:formate dehydrogenase accessory sulfurtransferase FdhD [Mycobacterium sp. 852013-50091_SCH5140682]OBC04580.1 sufurtransferase FdhD [Mycobacterium sp. 852013-50091_SCH5140682]
MGRVTSSYRVIRMADGVASAHPDTLAAEEPLEIRVDGRPLTVTMRTPGNDFDLARGFLVTEGVVSEPSDIAGIRYCAGATADGANTYNVLDVLIGPGVEPPRRSLERNFYTTSSCGVCGKASLEAVRTVSKWSADGDPLRLSTTTIAALPERLRAVQRIFDRTGGLHAAGLFDADGVLWCIREDVGRHNAVDKVVGWALEEGRLPLRGATLMVSGRASFELVQKAAMAGIPCLAAVSAPSSLAVELAREMGMTLVGFLRGSSMNVYSRAERIRADAVLPS